MAGAFQTSCFQDNAFQVFREIASTAVLQHPVNCVLAGDQPENSSSRSRVRRIDAKSLGSGPLRSMFNE